MLDGENTIGAIVADGWYAGYVGFGILEHLERSREFYGVDPALLCRIEIEYADGSRTALVSGPDWKAAEGPIRQADLLMGEVYDARLEQPGWDSPGFEAQSWAPASVAMNPDGALMAAPTDPVREIERLTPVSIRRTGPDAWIFDLGRNFAGTVALQVHGEAGRTVKLRYGEMLNADGSLMTENLRYARATDYYTLRNGSQSWMPRMTYHGFRYVELSGLGYEPDERTLTGIVLTSSFQEAGQFSCGNELVNRLWANISTTQRANFFEIPTDCPQRDERLGWTFRSTPDPPRTTPMSNRSFRSGWSIWTMLSAAMAPIQAMRRIRMPSQWSMPPGGWTRESSSPGHSGRSMATAGFCSGCIPG